MKTLFLLALVLAYPMASFNSSAAKPTAMLKNLNQLVWENRIIILNNAESSVLDPHKIFDEQISEIKDRDIIWFIQSSNKNKVESNFRGQLHTTLKQQLSFLTNNSNHRVILIGKDGEIKSQSKHLRLQKIFTQIDAMPMRIIEMQTNQKLNR